MTLPWYTPHRLAPPHLPPPPHSPSPHLPTGLAELLERCTPALEHVGIGSCAALPGDEALGLLAEQLPGLTALSAHKLHGLHGKGVELLFKSCPRLRSLDVADCPDLTFRRRPERDHLPPWLEEEIDIPKLGWIALDALRVGEHFVPGQVITAVGPLMSGRVPDDHPDTPASLLCLTDDT